MTDFDRPKALFDGGRRMTDFDKLKALFDEFGIGYDCGNWTNHKYGNHKYILIKEEKKYIGYCEIEFYFDENGKFIEVDAWE